MCTIDNNKFTDQFNTIAVIYIVRDPRNLITSLAHHYELSLKESFSFLANKRKIIFPKNFVKEDKSINKKQLYDVKIPIYWGGPVDDHKILILHSKDYKNESTKEYNNLSTSDDLATLVEIAEKKGPKKSLIVLGLAAWNTGQLDGELELEKWTLSESSVDLIFDMENKKKWLKAINNSFIRL